MNILFLDIFQSPQATAYIISVEQIFCILVPDLVFSLSTLPTMAAILSVTLLLATSALAQDVFPTFLPRQAAPSGPSALPLTDYTFTYPNVPYQVKYVEPFVRFYRN